MKRLLYIAKKQPRLPSKGAFIDALKDLGELTIIENGDSLQESEIAELIRGCNILLTNQGSIQVPLEVADNRGMLEYICNINASLREWIPLEVIDSGILVSNCGDAFAHTVAEGAMTLLLATLKDLHAQIINIRNDKWKLEPSRYPHGTLERADVGIYGLGAIGRRFVEMIKPYNCNLRVYDPYITDMPEGCTKVSTLEDLFSQSHIIVIHAGRCEETIGSVTAELLSMLPDNGIIINTARGAIIDQQALFSEIESGRLRAGLDVLEEPEELPSGHPARKWENCIITPHDIMRKRYPVLTGYMGKMFEICINIRSHINGEEVRFIMDHDRYIRST